MGFVGIWGGNEVKKAIVELGVAAESEDFFFNLGAEVL